MKANKHLLLWSSLAALAVLVWAAVHENYLSDWRVIQREIRGATPIVRGRCVFTATTADRQPRNGRDGSLCQLPRGDGAGREWYRRRPSLRAS